MFEEETAINQSSDDMQCDNNINESFSNYYFVDYENVNREGLNGIAKLTNSDCVRIYYSDSADTLTFGLHRRINTSQAVFKYIKIQIPIKNAVDCKILFDIVDISKENRKSSFYIVSNDTDYDKPVDYFNSINVNVKKIPQVYQHAEEISTEDKSPKSVDSTKQKSDTKKEAQIRTFFGQHFKKQIYKDHKEEIINTVMGSCKKQEVNNKLMRFYDSKTAGEVYKKLSKLMDQLEMK